MWGMKVFSIAIAAAALTKARAAPKFEINVIPRSQMKAKASPGLNSVPSRNPLPAFQGPFVSSLEPLPCIHEKRNIQGGKAYMLDLCLLTNVTIKVMIEESARVKVKSMESHMEGGDDDSATMEDPVSEEKLGPPISTILGIFRGWQMDPITMSYKNMVYDDGDRCMDTHHYSVIVELIPSDSVESSPKLFGLIKTGMCSFKASLLMYVSEDDRFTKQGIHTPGVVDISDARASLPVICGEMNCQYGAITKRLRDLSDEIRDIQVMITKGLLTERSASFNMTLEASKNTLGSTSRILERSLDLLHDVEDLQLTLIKRFSVKEDAAKTRFAGQEAEQRNQKEDINLPDGLDRVEEQGRAVA
ncbi:uncharacterized protein CCR75_005135 [Bremia lactucae]|uniref:Uncharacterized protein n=1 Tax=Bremia lactucae TaxID=4779 RepID=A0A976IGI6_BRELC|nr:hypothetical protein CCR75_005135 [Bremia lactucae]